MTPQYHGLNTLQTQHGADGFQVLGVPCNQFHYVSTDLNLRLIAGHFLLDH